MLKKQLSEFNRLMQGIEKVYEEYAKSAGLTYMSLTVLEIIYYAERSLTQKEICEQCHYNKQIVNAIVKDFLKKGYVSFFEVAEDRRNKKISFTPQGKLYANRIMQPLREIEKRALSVLSDEEREALLEMLFRCHQAFRER